MYYKDLRDVINSQLSHLHYGHIGNQLTSPVTFSLAPMAIVACLIDNNVNESLIWRRYPSRTFARRLAFLDFAAVFADGLFALIMIDPACVRDRGL